MASGTLLNVVCHPPSARVVAQMKNILALHTSKKYTLLYSIVPQKRLSCSSIPYIRNPIMIETTPTSIKANETVLNLPGSCRLYLIDEAIFFFYYLINCCIPYLG